MLRTAYHEALEATAMDLVRLGALLADSTACGFRAVRNHDAVLAARVIAGGDETETIVRRVEASCIEMIWKQQPVAGELREVAAMLEIATDFARVRVHGLDIAKFAAKLVEVEAPPAIDQAAIVAALVVNMLEAVVIVYRDRKVDLVKGILDDQDRVEEAYGKAIKALEDAIRANSDAISAGTTMLLLLAALQRISEHAANIAWQTREMAQS